MSGDIVGFFSAIQYTMRAIGEVSKMYDELCYILLRPTSKGLKGLECRLATPRHEKSKPSWGYILAPLRVSLASLSRTTSLKSRLSICSKRSHVIETFEDTQSCSTEYTRPLPQYYPDCQFC